MNSEEYSLLDAIDIAIKAAQLDTHTAIPAEVISYDSKKQTVQVQISIDRSVNGKQIKYPILEEIGVVFPRSAKGGITFPLAKGDGVLLVFSERSLEAWKSGNGKVPLDGRKFDINDAVAIPGLFNKAGAMSPPPANGTDVRGDKILIGNTGKADEPLVLGNILQGNLEDLIDGITDLIALITSGQAIADPNSGLSTIVTAAVEASLAGVKSALSNQNSAITSGE